MGFLGARHLKTLAIAGLLAGCAGPAYNFPPQRPANFGVYPDVKWGERMRSAQERYPAGTPLCHDYDTCKDECDHDRAMSCFALGQSYLSGEWGHKDVELGDRLMHAVCTFAQAQNYGNTVEANKVKDGGDLGAACCAYSLELRLQSRRATCDGDPGCAYSAFLRQRACLWTCSRQFSMACTERGMLMVEEDPPSKLAPSVLRSACKMGEPTACTVFESLPQDWVAKVDHDNDAQDALQARLNRAGGSAIARLQQENAAISASQDARNAQAQQQARDEASAPKPAAPSGMSTYEVTKLEPPKAPVHVCYKSRFTGVDICSK